MAVNQTIKTLFALSWLAGCGTTPVAVLESTTTEIPAEGGVALSADGLFSVRLEAQNLAAVAEVEIYTEATAGPEGVLSRVYRVSISELALRTGGSVRLGYDSSRIGVDGRLAIARVLSSANPIRMSSSYDADGHRVQSVIGVFSVERFGVTAAPPPPSDASDLECCRDSGAMGVCETPAEREARILAGDACPPADGGGMACGVDQDCAPAEVFDEPSWDAPPASGRTFVINQLAIATDPTVGFDLDGQCRGPGGCIDNLLLALGGLGNDQIRQGLLGGETLLLLELAGLDDPYFEQDSSLTLKLYAARDADDPFFPANNFAVPPGHTTCCEFKINPQSLAGTPPQARSRLPAEITAGRLRGLAPTALQVTLTIGVPPHPELRLERVQISGRAPGTLDEITDGIVGAGLSINTLAQTENPYCTTVSPSCPIAFPDSRMIDLVSSLIAPQPDLDIDGDGLEVVLDTDGDGAVDLCCDGAPAWGAGAGTVACGPGVPTVAPIDSARPGTCALAPEMADAYSIAFTFTAVPARIVGIGQ